MKKWAILILIGFVLTISLAGYKTFLSLTHPIKYASEIEYYSQKYNLDPGLVASVVNVESSYKTKAKSNKNAIGLMQIKLSTANYLNNINLTNEISESDLFKPTTNLDYGCMYLRYLINKFDDTTTALCAYNAGETRVRSWLKSGIYSLDGKTLNYIPYLETRNYIEKINSNLKFYNKVYKK